MVAPEDYILPLLCDETKTRPEGVPCFTDEELRRVLPLAKELRHMLSDHAGNIIWNQETSVSNVRVTIASDREE